MECLLSFSLRLSETGAGPDYTVQTVQFLNFKACELVSLFENGLLVASIKFGVAAAGRSTFDKSFLGFA